MATPNPKNVAATVLYVIGVFALIYLTESSKSYTLWQVVWITAVLIFLLVVAGALSAAGERERKRAAARKSREEETGVR